MATSPSKSQYGYKMNQEEIDLAIKLFNENNGMGTVARMLREITGKNISEPQVRVTLTKLGHHRNKEQARVARPTRVIERRR